LEKSEQNLQFLKLNFNSETCYFNKVLPKIWPFSFLRIWSFLILIMAKFDLLNFFVPGNPATFTNWLVCMSLIEVKGSSGRPGLLKSCSGLIFKDVRAKTISDFNAAPFSSFSFISRGKEIWQTFVFDLSTIQIMFDTFWVDFRPPPSILWHCFVPLSPHFQGFLMVKFHSKYVVGHFGLTPSLPMCHLMTHLRPPTHPLGLSLIIWMVPYDVTPYKG